MYIVQNDHARHCENIKKYINSQNKGNMDQGNVLL